MFTIGSNGNNIAYGIKHFVLDDDDDLEQLSKTEKMGTTCFVIETSQYYMLNGKQKWVKISPYGTTSGSSGGGGGESPDNDIIYEGGVI